MELDRDALDRWITSGRYDETEAQVWCHNEECREYGTALDVVLKSEYGTSWMEPEECPTCGAELHEDEPEDGA